MTLGVEQKRKRFLLETEQAIRDINREIIHERIPKITRASILPMATTVARMRARYLEAAFHMADMNQSTPIDEKDVESLSHHRELYEESRDAFDALIRAIEQGYVDVEDD